MSDFSSDFSNRNRFQPTKNTDLKKKKEKSGQDVYEKRKTKTLQTYYKNTNKNVYYYCYQNIIVSAQTCKPGIFEVFSCESRA